MSKTANLLRRPRAVPARQTPVMLNCLFCLFVSSTVWRGEPGEAGGGGAGPGEWGGWAAADQRPTPSLTTVNSNILEFMKTLYKMHLLKNDRAFVTSRAMGLGHTTVIFMP